MSHISALDALTLGTFSVLNNQKICHGALLNSYEQLLQQQMCDSDGEFTFTDVLIYEWEIDNRCTCQIRNKKKSQEHRKKYKFTVMHGCLFPLWRECEYMCLGMCTLVFKGFGALFQSTQQ